MSRMFVLSFIISFEILNLNVATARVLNEVSVDNVIYRIGEEVIYRDSATTLKGRIIDLTEDGYAKLDFGNRDTNIFYGNYIGIKKSLAKYLPTQQVFVSSFWSSNQIVFAIGEEVIYQDSATTLKGRIIDLTEDGYAKLDFGNRDTNIFYGNYIGIKKSLTKYLPTQQVIVSSFWSSNQIVFAIGEEVIYRDSATTLKGRIIDLTEDGYAKLDFGNRDTNIFYGNYHSIKESLMPSR